MKFVRLAFLLCVCASFSFGASKEIVELQRDVAILQDQVRQVQRTLDEKMAQLTLLVQQTQDNSSKASSSVANIQSSVSQSVGQQLQPVLGLGNKVDSLTDNVRGLQSSIGDLNSRLSQLDAKVTDLGNKITLSQNPPAAPGATGAAAPPPGMTAESAWTNAERDRLGGNSDLALKEYQDYLTYFPNTDYAPSAQFYVGQIYYNRGDYDNALKALSAVEERYPDNPKTRSAMYLKGQTLVKTGDRQGAVQEFRQIMSKYPGTEEARRSSQQLKALGVSASAKPSPARRR
ncbi:MAG TPA: tetratricopeptide repeat protein [Bryobacteraceae bacterium]|nr:tetratricopeptide repeat protein [Bryobacteraceae bacterium]